MNDVIIIGAGPAGTCCAKKLAENGFSVKVFDRRQEIGSPKRCAEGVNVNVQDTIGKIPDRCIAQNIKGARIYAPNGRYLQILLSYGGFVLERKIFDKWLAEEAVKAGAEIQANTFISGLIKNNGYFSGVKGEFLGDEFELLRRRPTLGTHVRGILPLVQKPADSATPHFHENHLRHQCSWNADAINKLAFARQQCSFCHQKRLQLIQRHTCVDLSLNDSSRTA
jgi:hypothetical protein